MKTDNKNVCTCAVLIAVLTFTSHFHSFSSVSICTFQFFFQRHRSMCPYHFFFSFFFVIIVVVHFIPIYVHLFVLCVFQLFFSLTLSHCLSLYVYCRVVLHVKNAHQRASVMNMLL